MNFNTIYSLGRCSRGCGLKGRWQGWTGPRRADLPARLPPDNQITADGVVHSSVYQPTNTVTGQ